MTNKNSTYRRLGDYIREINVRNKDLFVSKLMGINIDKYFMPSVANVIGTDMSNYKVVANGQFACNLMHVGRDEKIPVALNTEDPIIVSPAYFVFEVCDDSLLPEYLELSLRNPEFDRNAWFHTDGDVRGGMDKEGMKDLLIPVPSLEEQRSIVSRYKAIETRISNNKQTIAKLEEAAQALYRKMFVDDVDVENLPDGWRMGCLGEVAEINPSLKIKNDFCSYIDMDAVSTEKMTTSIKGTREKTGGSKFQNDDVLLARISPCFENGKVGIVIGLKENEIAIGSTEFIVLRGREANMPMFLYLICKSNEFRAYGSKHLKGTDGRQRLDWQSVADYPMIIPSLDVMNKLNNYFNAIFGFVLNVELENEKLKEMLSLMA